MLIQALCDYYDILAERGKVLPDGYSKVKIHYLVALTEDGRIDEIINYQVKEESVTAKGKVKERLVPREILMPRTRTIRAIHSNIIEHRPRYIFGLDYRKERLFSDDNRHYTSEAHKDFKSRNKTFFEGLHSPLIDAFCRFIDTWNPQEQTDNAVLLDLGSDYLKSGYAFCLSGYPEHLLQDDLLLKQRWDQYLQYEEKHQKNIVVSQCAIEGKVLPIAQIHDDIKNLYGGGRFGASSLISYHNPSEQSYGKKDSYNSNISLIAMKKYTEALNYLLSDPRHKMLLDDVTVVFWAMSPQDEYEDLMKALIFGSTETMNAGQTEDMLCKLLADAREGRLTKNRLTLDQIDPAVEFFMLGIKPYESRISVKFLYRSKYADILWNVARFQQDLQIGEKIYPISIGHIIKELVSPKRKDEKVNPSLLSQLMEAVFHGKKYPTALLETVIRRVKTDIYINDTSEKDGGAKTKNNAKKTDTEHPNKKQYDALNRVRAGVIKACINRNYKEEIKMALDRENDNQAYLCGRLFAVLEKIQMDASPSQLNRTIKDTFFATASTKPTAVFPKLLRLAQNHLAKLDNPTYDNILLGEIMDGMQGGFPESLSLQDQGRFMIGYYQQRQSFFTKKPQDVKEDI